MLHLLGLRHADGLKELLRRGTKMRAWDPDNLEIGLMIANYLPMFSWRLENYQIFKRDRVSHNQVWLDWPTDEVILPSEVIQDWYYLAFDNELEYVNRYGKYPTEISVSPIKNRATIVTIGGDWVEETL
jgi:hypothetical protein